MKKKKKIFPMMNKFWHDEYGKPRKLWHGGYSTLEYDCTCGRLWI